MNCSFESILKKFAKIIVLFPLLTVFIYQNSAAQPGITWTTRISAKDNSWNSVTYGNGVYVAVASSGTNDRVMTSPDGKVWTARVSAADLAWQSVTYGNGLFVAVASSGTGNRVMTSTNGITWTSRASATDNNWQAVTFGNGLFVAVAWTGTGNRVMTSPNGINWTSRASAADNDWQSVTYGNGLFVAVASAASSSVMTSPDGITWTSRNGIPGVGWLSVAYGNGLFVAVGGTVVTDPIMTSPDGINWTSRPAPVNNSWRSVTYGLGLFVAVSISGTGNRVMTSSDGINWTIRTSAGDVSWRSVTYARGLFVAVANTGTANRVMTSGSFIPVPLHWLRITGDLYNAKKARIQWCVAERNVKVYEIEKSSDGVRYTQIGSINGKGDGENCYEFIEQQILSATTRYRIKQTDIDGKFTYSRIIVLRPGNELSIAAYPNPAKDDVTVLVDKKSLHKNIVITDMYGNALQTIKISSLSFAVSLHSYPAGCYILNIANEKRLKIIKE